MRGMLVYFDYFHKKLYFIESRTPFNETLVGYNTVGPVDRMGEFTKAQKQRICCH